MKSSRVRDYALNGSLYRRFVGAAAQNIAMTLGMSKSDINMITNQMSGLPVIGDILRADAQFDYISDYMDKKGLDWADVKYPALVDAGQFDNARLLATTKNFVSRNIFDLYK